MSWLPTYRVPSRSSSTISMPVSRPTTHLTASRRSALVEADELGHREHLASERLLQVGHAGAGREPEFLVKGVEPEPVAVGAVPAGWAGP
jgi:hypothetical protein